MGGKEAGFVQFEAPIGYPGGDVCLRDFGWNSVERSGLGREIEELVVYRRYLKPWEFEASLIFITYHEFLLTLVQGY